MAIIGSAQSCALDDTLPHMGQFAGLGPTTPPLETGPYRVPSFAKMSEHCHLKAHRVCWMEVWLRFLCLAQQRQADTLTERHSHSPSSECWVIDTMVGYSTLIFATFLAGGALSCLTEENEVVQDLEQQRANARRARRNSERRQLRRTARKWLAEHDMPKAVDHPYVYRLFTEMGDHPLNRDYFIIAHRRVARWFDEGWTMKAAASSIAAKLYGDIPDTDEEKVEFEAFEAFLVDDISQAFSEDPCGFLAEWKHVVPSIQPPPAIAKRYACQIIEAAIAMRVEDVEESQNVLRSQDVRLLGTDNVSWWTIFQTWRAGLTGWFPRGPPPIPAPPH